MSGMQVSDLVTNEDRFGVENTTIVKDFPELYSFTKYWSVARIILNQGCILPPKNLSNVDG